MTVKELKELIKNIPDDYIVAYDYDGPDASAEIPAKYILVNIDYKTIIITETQNE